MRKTTWHHAHSHLLGAVWIDLFTSRLYRDVCKPSTGGNPVLFCRGDGRCGFWRVAPRGSLRALDAARVGSQSYILAVRDLNTAQFVLDLPRLARPHDERRQYLRAARWCSGKRNDRVLREDAS